MESKSTPPIDYIDSCSQAEFTASNPGLADVFPNADRRAPFPSTIISDGFDLEIDGQTHLVPVHILLPTERGYDGGAEWRWPDFTDPPFELGDPIVVARFRADGVRVDLDGTYCTSRIVAASLTSPGVQRAPGCAQQRV